MVEHTFHRTDERRPNDVYYISPIDYGGIFHWIHYHFVFLLQKKMYFMAIFTSPLININKKIMNPLRNSDDSNSWKKWSQKIIKNRRLNSIIKDSKLVLYSWVFDKLSVSNIFNNLCSFVQFSRTLTCIKGTQILTEVLQFNCNVCIVQVFEIIPK